MNIKLSSQDLEDLQKQAKLACLPNSRLGITKRAQSEGWPYVSVKGKGGRTGLKRIYTLPDYVIDELESRHLMHLLPKNEIIEEIEEIDVLYSSINTPKQPIVKKSVDKYKDHSTILEERNYELWAAQQDHEEILPIRYCKNVWASAGYGMFPYDETTDVIWFRKSFIINYLGVRPAKCVCIRVHGDSMLPTIKADGTVLVEMGADYCGEGIYLIRHGDELKIKRLQRLSPEVMRIISDNKELYPPQDLDISVLPEDEFAILGRYLWDAGIAK